MAETQERNPMTQDEFNGHILTRLDRLDSKLESSVNRLDNKIDKMMYVLIGVGVVVLVSLITGIISLLINLR